MQSGQHSAAPKWPRYCFSWIPEWEGIDNNHIVFYKLQGQLKEEVALEKGSFVVILQTEFQKHHIEKLGSNEFCCGNTHETTGYGSKLLSLLLLDELEEGVPEAFCLSSRDNLFSYNFFSAQYLITRVEHSLVGLWVTLPQNFMKLLLKLLNATRSNFCVWDVDKAWKKELRGEVKNFESQTIIYKYLWIALEQTDPLVLKDCLTEILRRLTLQKETKQFENYFQSFRIPPKNQCSFAYRVREGINTSMFCKSFRRVFKYKYLKGKLNKKVDKCHLNLVKFNRDKVFERFSKLTKGEYSSRMHYIKESHQVKECHLTM